jgi:unsaturated rhamnogalacturonyl hydrolase
LNKSATAFDQFLKQFIVENPDGTISMKNCCVVSGLGGKGNRDGSFEYYISEPIRDNDAKGVGPFIMAGVLLNK